MKRTILAVLAGGVLLLAGMAAVPALAKDGPPNNPCPPGQHAVGKSCVPNGGGSGNCGQNQSGNPGDNGFGNGQGCTVSVSTSTSTSSTTHSTTTSTTTTVPGGPRCPPGEGPYAGKDGQPGNQECCPDLNLNQRCDNLPAPVGDLPPVVNPASLQLQLFHWHHWKLLRPI